MRILGFMGGVVGSELGRGAVFDLIRMTGGFLGVREKRMSRLKVK